MGPTDGQNNCPTCYLNYTTCPGHCGHIELDVPVSNIIIIIIYNKYNINCALFKNFKPSSNSNNVGLSTLIVSVTVSNIKNKV